MSVYPDNMEARKIIKFGNSSHVISVPKEWMKENGLKKGDLVFIEKNDGNGLTLSSKEKKEEKKGRKIIISGKGKNYKYIEREIVSAYVGGYSTIVLENHGLQTEDIKSIVSELSGFEMTRKSANEVVIKDILDIESVSIPSLVRRIDNNVRGMLEDFGEAIKNKELREKKYKEIYDADGEVNKTYRLALKVLKYGLNNEQILKKSKINPVNAVDIFLLVMTIEHIGDEIKRAARSLKSIKTSNRLAKKVSGVYSEITDTYYKTMKIYYKKEYEDIYELAIKKPELIEECNAIAKENPSVKEIMEKLKAIKGWVYQITEYIAFFGK